MMMMVMVIMLNVVAAAVIVIIIATTTTTTMTKTKSYKICSYIRWETDIRDSDNGDSLHHRYSILLKM
jgi:ABC-type uncharacterized transport system permease subunit